MRRLNLFLIFFLSMTCFDTVIAQSTAVIPAEPSGTVTGTNGHPAFAIQPHPAQYVRVIVVRPAPLGTEIDAWFTVEPCQAYCVLLPAEPIPALPTGMYTLYMQGYVVGQGYTDWSAGQSFTIKDFPPAVSTLKITGIHQDTSGTPCEPVTTEPTCHTPTPAITYTVEAASGDWVEVLIAQSDTMIFREWVNVYDPRCEGFSCAVTITTPLEDAMTYTVYLRSYGAGGLSTGGINGYTRPGSSSEGDPDRLAHFRISLAEKPLQNLTSQIVQGDVHLDWDHTAYATWYEVQITNLSGQIIHQQWYSADLCNTQCGVYPDIAFSNGTYTWAVRYWNAALSPWYAAPTGIALNEPPPRRVVPDSHEDGNLRWGEVDHASWYQLVIENSSGETVFSEWYRAAMRCATLCVVQPLAQLQPGNYVWYVTAYGPGGQTSPLESARLPIPPAGIPTLIYPIDAATVSGSFLLLEWQDTGAASYHLQLIDTSTQAILYDAQFRREDAACSQLCYWIQEDLPPNGYYQWRVKAAGLAESEWSLYGRFSVNIPPAVPPQPVAPAGGTIHPAPPDFVWKPAQFAVWYQLLIEDKQQQRVWEQWYSAEDNCGEFECRVGLPDEALDSGTYRWTVVSWGQGGQSPIPPDWQTWIQL